MPPRLIRIRIFACRSGSESPRSGVYRRIATLIFLKGGQRFIKRNSSGRSRAHFKKWRPESPDCLHGSESLAPSERLGRTPGSRHRGLVVPFIFLQLISRQPCRAIRFRPHCWRRLLSEPPKQDANRMTGPMQPCRRCASYLTAPLEARSRAIPCRRAGTRPSTDPITEDAVHHAGPDFLKRPGIASFSHTPRRALMPQRKSPLATVKTAAALAPRPCAFPACCLALQAGAA